MKKFCGVLFILVGALMFSCINVKAAETNPIEYIDYCGIVKTIRPNVNIRLKKQNNTCKVTVKLKDSSYTVVSGDGNIKFENGMNKHEIVVKDSTGNTTTYTINVEMNGTSTNGNPSTGDTTVLYYGIGALALAGIAIGFNRVKKYSKEI